MTEPILTVDDFSVALPVGATYTLRLTGDRLWCAATEQFQKTLPPGKYRVKIWHERAKAAEQVVDVGTGGATVNLELQGK